MFLQIKVIGTRGDGYRSDIAMDDFKIFQEHCSKYQHCDIEMFNTV